MRSSCSLLALLTVLIAPTTLVLPAAQALDEPHPRDPPPAPAHAPAPFQLLCHASASLIALVGAVIRRKYYRTLHGQLDFVDMVQVIALCSIIHGIRRWRKRSLTQKGTSGTHDTSHIGHRAASSSRKALSQVSIESTRRGGSRWRMY